jgi:acetyl esterase/lipase
VFAIRPGSVTKFTGLEMLANLNEGIRWVKDHADTYKVDPNRLGLMGASAGGHLACLAAVTATTGKAADNAQSRRGTDVKAVAVLFPPTDFLDFGGKPTDVRSNNGMGELIRGLAFPRGISNESESEIADKLKQISPARLVTPKTPPFLLIHGDADPVVPLQQSERMLAALKQAGVSAKLIVKHGGGHPWLTLHEEVQVLADWFDSQLGANGNNP